MRRDDMLDGFVNAKFSVNSLEDAAEVMGVTLSALEKALERARARGDHRGRYAPLRIKRPRDRRARRHEIGEAYAALTRPRGTYAESAEKIGCTRQALATTLSRLRREEGWEFPENINIEAVLEDWEILRAGDVYWEFAAKRLGLTVHAFRNVLHDARSAGDPRGQLTLVRKIET